MARLFIPGPTDVHPEVLAAQAQPMIGHRSPEFFSLFERVQPKLREVLLTKQRVFITASSGSGLQEAALRNCVAERALVAVCGAFGDRWYKVAAGNNVPADRLDAELGQPNTADQVLGALENGNYDALAIVHNETSTGVENPIAEIASRARAVRPDLMILVDAVSSAGGVRIETDGWDLDVLLTSSQKCFALPPGLAFAAVSDRALEKARGLPHRGWYFDFLLLEKYLVERSSTPATPAVSLLYALDVQLDRMLAEGLEARFQRHTRMAERVRSWATGEFDLFAAEGYRSKTVTTILNTPQIEIGALRKHLSDQGMTIASGYGPLKESTFRIGHMGEIQPEDVEMLLDSIDGYLKQEA